MKNSKLPPFIMILLRK